MGHGRQQARRARLGLASGGHNCLARLPRVCELVAARQARAHLGAQREGRSDRSKERTAQADARSRKGAHGAQITSGTAPGIPAYVRPAGEPASRGGTPAFAACYSSVDSSRHRGGPPAGVGTGGAVRAARRTLYCCFPCNGAAAQHRLRPATGAARFVLVGDRTPSPAPSTGAFCLFAGLKASPAAQSGA